MNKIDFTIKELEENGYKNLGNTIINRNEKITLIDKDGYLYYKSVNSLKKEKWRCKKIHKNNPYALYNINKITREKYGLVCIDDVYYSYSNQKLKWICPKCGDIFEATLNHIENGRTPLCLKCSKESYSNNNSIDDKTIIDSFEKVGLKLFTTSNLRANNIYTAIDNEGYLYYTTYQHGVKHGHKGKIIDSKNPYTIYNIKLFISKNNLNCELISEEYINSNTKLKFKCHCGEEYLISWNSLYNYKIDTCECCRDKMSSGERLVGEYLDLNNIKYSREFKFVDCKNKKPLPFDMAIYDNDYNLIGLIEVDGIQHFEPIDYFGGVEHFEYTKNNDNIKNNYCNKNNIPLLRIKYDRFDNELYKGDIDKFIKQL